LNPQGYLPERQK